MKNLYKFWILAIGILLVGCTDDPLEDLEGTAWQKERNIVSLLLEGQIGTALIERDLDEARIKVFAKTENIADLAKVEIKEIQLSYGAYTEQTVGTTLDFTSGETMLEIKSGAGEPLAWHVELLPFKSDLEGTWYVGQIGLYADLFTWESWGWEKYEQINNYLPELNPEFDNTITFTVEGADENGNPFGVYEHNAGNDGLYGSFTDVANEWDFNDRFRKIPKGRGTWSRNFELNKVIITDADRVVHELDLEVLAETGEVSLKAEVPYQPELFDWNEQNWSYEELAHMSRSMWYTLTKEYEAQTGNDITAITVADQDGEASIDVDNHQVTVTVQDNGADSSAIELTGLALSYGATASVAVGDALNFTTGNATTVTVTSEAGESQNWTVNLVVKQAIEGTYTMASALIHVNQEWGSDFSKEISTDFPDALAEYDNQIRIVNEGMDGDRPFGTLTNSAGADGIYGDFNHPDADVDLNAKLRHLVPTGDSYWELDTTTGIFYIGASKDEITSQATLIATETGYVLAFELPYRELEPRWDYGNYDNYMCWTYKYEVYINKN